MVLSGGYAPGVSAQRSGLGRLGAALLALVAVVGLAGGGRTLVTAYGPVDRHARDKAQLRFLYTARDDGAAEQMQQVFPEGRFFTVVLSALAAARLDDPDVPALRTQLALLDSPALTEPFGSGLTPRHGIFHAGWTLLLATEIARVSPDRTDVNVVTARADAVAAALAADPAGFPESYPGGRWPCDAVVAAAALARADATRSNPAWERALSTWRARAEQHLDPTTGLLPHRVDASGAAEEGPRGSSQAIVQAFWPDIAISLDEQPDLETWRAYVAAFVVRRAGLVGVREFPAGTGGSGDVDSGPLLFGVSASASAVTLAAALRNGDVELANALDREAELVGAGVTLGGERRYALGRLPVGDAFLLWARTIEPGVVPDPQSGAPSPSWPALAAVGLGPGGVAVVALLVLRRTRLRRARAGTDRSAGP